MLSGTALVTGASSGIGRAVAVGLAARGMAVGLLARHLDRLEPVAAEIRAAGGTAAVQAGDVIDVDQVDRAVTAVEDELGPLDLLVNSAGRIEAAEVPLWESDPQEWWGVIEANLRGPYLLMRRVTPGMVARGGGRVVNLNSGFGTRDGATYSAYGASKTALFRLTGALSLAGAEHGVRSFELAPGLVRTPMSAGMAMHERKGEDAWTPMEAVVELLAAVAAGRLDDYSGRFLRAGTDTEESLRSAAAEALDADGRTLRLRPWGSGDPLA